jgi:hypothetical protein
VAVLVIKRPDDADGIGFARQLAASHERIGKRRIHAMTVERVE